MPAGKRIVMFLAFRITRDAGSSEETPNYFFRMITLYADITELVQSTGRAVISPIMYLARLALIRGIWEWISSSEQKAIRHQMRQMFRANENALVQVVNERCGVTCRSDAIFVHQIL
ncbi:hypothetical protein [Undibacterium griseum]|uniref:Uncharacterized protein n=1 Tax=Undibacterium griseum TaxID=2762295 RepID=A0ABR6YL82_9BURK|nr:hypothetical protein [Undibacterium griseum]MBC3884574.1 hypothetical protein [Undibacterium griseum]